MSMQNQESERSCMCVRGIDFADFSDFSVRFWNCLDGVVSFVFHFIVVQDVIDLKVQQSIKTVH